MANQLKIMRKNSVLLEFTKLMRLLLLCALLPALWGCASTPSPAPSPTAQPKPTLGTKPAYPVHIPFVGQTGSTAPAPTAYPAAPAGKTPTVGVQPAAKGFNLDSLKNLEYSLPDLPGGKARLQNGTYTAKAPAGSTGETTLRLTNSAAGDLTRDGTDDAVAILVLNAGGSGSFYTLAAVISEINGPRHVASSSLGDRVAIKSITITGGMIRLEMITHGPNDPLCCPTQAAVKHFRLSGSTLEEVK